MELSVEQLTKTLSAHNFNLFALNQDHLIVGIHEDGEGHWEELAEEDPEYMAENYPDWEPEEDEPEETEPEEEVPLGEMEEDII